MTELWKKYKFKGVPSYALRIEVSNLGRVKSYSRVSNGELVKAGNINGYLRMNLKYIQRRGKKEQENLFVEKSNVRKEREWIAKSEKKIATLKFKKQPWKQKEKMLLERKQKLKLKIKDNSSLLLKDQQQRIVHFGAMVHRMVAELFLPKPKVGQHFVIHLDFNKKNNAVKNLRWASQAELTRHNEKNPSVIRAKKNIKTRKLITNAKLNPQKVLQIKNLLVRGKTLREIAKKFHVSDMQIYRIRTGENWGKLKA